MQQQIVTLSIDANQIAWVTLNRAEKHNAFCGDTIARLTDIFQQLQDNQTIRAMVLQNQGKHFSAGADLNWMKASAKLSEQQNQRDAAKLAALFRQLNELPFFTIANVKGSTFGGGLGLICCCDLAVAESRSKFCFSEVKLGLIPATIGPYVIAAMGQRQARRYLLSAEVMDANQAKTLGLIHEIVEPSERQGWLQQQLQIILNNCPAAIEHSKTLIKELPKVAVEQRDHYTSSQIAKRRVSSSAQAGLQAFFEQQPAPWCIALEQKK